MPKIPTSQRQVITRAQNLGQQRVGGVADTGDLGTLQAANTFVNTVSGIADKWQRDADQTELTAYKTRLRDYRNKVMHDKDSGFMNVRGKDSAEMYMDYKKEYDDFVGKEVDGMSSRLKEQAFQMGESYKVDIDNQMNQHTSREMERYSDDVFKVGLNSLTENAKLNWKTPKVGESLMEQKELIAEYAQRKGLGPEQIKALELQESSKFHESLITQAVNNGEDELASQYYKSAMEMEQIDGSTKEKLDKILNVSSVLGKSQRESARIFSEYSDDMGKALEEARKIKDPEIQDATVRRIKNRFQEQKAIIADRQNKNFNDASQMLEQSGDIDSIPRTLMSELNSSDIRRLEQRSRQIRMGIEPVTDFERYYELRLMASNPNTREKFLQMNLMKERNHLDNTHFERLISLQDGVRKGSSKALKEIRGIRSNNQIAKDTLKAAGIDNDKSVVNFARKLDEIVIDWKQDNPDKPLPPNFVQDAANGLATKVITDVGTFWDTEKRVFELEPGEAAVGIDYDEIPEKEKRLLEQYFRVKGIPFDEDVAIQKYQKRLAQVVR